MRVRFLVFLCAVSFCNVLGQTINPWELPHLPNAEHTCIMWGECFFDGRHHKNCYYNGPATRTFHQYLTDDERNDVLRVLQTRCPHLLYDENGNELNLDDVYGCCATEQIVRMGESLAMAEGVLGRCPTCVRNYMRQTCELTCAPDQSRFLVPYLEESPTDGAVYVNEVDYHMHDEFMNGAHGSCEGVIVPQTGIPAINIMCGSAPVCTAQAWFDFSGDFGSNDFVPFQVNYIATEDPEVSMNAQALPCNETIEGTLPCSCVDCMMTCPIGTEPFVPESCTVLGVNCISFSVGLVAFVVTVTIFLILTLVDYIKMRKIEESKSNDKKTNTNRLIQVFEWIFAKIGLFSAAHPLVILMFTSWISIAMFYGFFMLNLTTVPLELWSSPESRTRQDLNYFNSRFGPFYRAAQVYLQVTGLEPFEVVDEHGNVTVYGPAFRFEAIQKMIELEKAIKDIGREDDGVVLEEVCYAPLRVRGTEQLLEQCVTMSASTYLPEGIDNSTYLNDIGSCLNNYMNVDCLASWGGGTEPEMAFGGYEGEDYLSANTLLLNFPISNFLSESELAPVLEWEQRFLDLMHNYEAHDKPDFFDISYAAERSIEDEIQRISVAEMVPIGISYVLMFIYVTISLGNLRSLKTFFVDSKIGVGLGSIIVVVLSIICAIGTMGYAGITTTLLAINVIPFFILSIGVDNVFLMLNALHDITNNLKEYEDYKENFSFSKKRQFVFEKMLRRVGPSIFVSSLTQITCFAIGTISAVPAVQTFAVFASFALGYLFVFQITTVVAILSIDFQRSYQNRLDIFCCIKRKILDDSDPLTSETPHKGLMQRLMKPYARFILNWRVKIVVAILFMAFLSICAILIPQVEIGLDQELSLPKDSYVYKYLQAVNNLLSLGPPVYFVLKPGLNFTDPIHQNTICGGQLCNNDSLTTQIFLASRYSNITRISKPSNSWLDDFFDWSTLRYSCCRYVIDDNTYCSSNNNSELCRFCEIDLDENGLRPLEHEFQQYIPFFLRDEPTQTCNKGGLASYSTAVNYLLDEEGRATVYETNFMAFHTSLATSHDYTEALKWALEISENITSVIHSETGMTDVEVFPYSVFYVYYEQYLTIWVDTFRAIGFSLIGALVFALVLSGFNFFTTFAIMITVIMIVVDMMGLMYMWNIPLNAVSLVNLIISIGIAVEFCSHTAYAYATSSKPIRERTEDALLRVGSTIVTGITLTNIPIIVLYFSYTEIIEIFFFRMFFGLVVIGFAHGMIFFPVLLSYMSNVFSYRS